MREYTVNRRTARTYTSTRRSANALNSRTSTSATFMNYGTSYSRNRNTVHQGRFQRLGSFAEAGLLIAVVAAMGMIYVSSGTRGTSFDYEIAAMDEQISDLTAQKEDLAVEQARLTSIAASSNSKVAAAMPEAGEASTYTE